MTSYLDTADSINELISIHNTAIENGYNLVDTEYVEGTWIATLRNTGGDSSSFSESDFTGIDQREGTSREWTISGDDNPIIGYNLLDVEYGDGTWYSTYGSDAAGVSDASISNDYDYDAFTGEIQAKANSGYSLVDVEYADGDWVGTYSSAVNTRYTSNPTNLSDLETLAADQRSEGFGLIDVEYTGNGSWFGVFRSDGGNGSNFATSQGNYGEFQTEVSQNSAAGYDIIDVSYGDGSWVGTYSATIADETYTTPILSDQSQLSQGFNDFVIS